MAIKPLNSVAGFSVGETPTTIVLANGDITTTNITTTGVANLNAIGNVRVAGGSAGQVIQTDGAGNLTFVTISTSTLTNGTSNISVLNNGNITFSSAGNANIVVITGTGANVTGTLGVSGNANVGNLGTAGLVVATGNVSGGNLTTAGVVAATGNITGGNLTTGGVLSVTGNANVGNLGTGGLIVATGNVTGGNLVTGGALSVTGNANTGNLGTGTAIITTGNITTINSGLLQNGNSNVTITANGNVSTFVTGNVTAQLIVTATGTNTAGYANVVGNANVGNLGTAGLVVATGNVTGGNLTTGGIVSATGNITTAAQLVSSVAVGTAPIVVTSTTLVPNLYVARANLADNINVAAGTGNNFIIFANAATGNIAELTSTGLIANLSNNSITATTFVGNLSATTATITTGNITTINSGLMQNGNSNVTITANANVSVFVTGNSTSQFTVAATGTNTAGYANVVGNANVGNLGTAGLIVATGNITGGNLVTGGVLNVTGTGLSSIAGNLDMTSNTIINLATPTNPNDAATKQYVDDVAQGLNIHDSCVAATPANLATITSGTITYNNGTSGVGANLTTTGTFTTIDGVNIATVGSRILVKNETNTAWNGIYTYSNATVITRATDYNTVPEVEAGDFVFVTGGTAYDNTGWVQTSTVVTIGTDPIEFTQFSGAGTYQAGTGLTLTGATFSITNTAVTAASYGNGDRVATFTVNGQGQLTAASNTVISANAANLTGTTLGATIVTSSLTTVGTLGTLSVTGNANVGNLGTGGLIVATGNITGGNLVTTGTANIGTLAVTGTSNLGPVSNVTITGGTSGQYLKTNGSGVLSFGTVDTDTLANGTSNVDIPVANGNVLVAVGGTANVAVFTATGVNVSGTLNATGNANVGNLGTTTAIITTGNITTINSGLLQNGNSNVTITANGNVTLNAVGGARVIATATGANVTGTLGVSGNANVGNLGTAGLIVATGNVSGGNISAGTNVSIGNTTITWANVTTSAITANQTISSVSVTGITGVEFLVKATDATGAKYSVAKVQAVTDGTNVDYTTFGTVQLGGYTGSLAVNVVGGFLRLQVTPASSNSTVWTTQYRLI